LLDHSERRNISFQDLSSSFSTADRMLDVAFPTSAASSGSAAERQTMLFSATLPEAILNLAREVTHNAAQVQVQTGITPDAIAQTFFPVPEHLKSQVLQQLLREEEMDSVLIFARTKHRIGAKQLGCERSRTRDSASPQSQRIAAQAFRAGTAFLCDRYRRGAGDEEFAVVTMCRCSPKITCIGLDGQDVCRQLAKRTHSSRPLTKEWSGGSRRCSSKRSNAADSMGSTITLQRSLSRMLKPFDDMPPQIVTAIRNLFSPKQHRFLFGSMASLSLAVFQGEDAQDVSCTLLPK
jgi:hypothetical protein